MIVKQTMRLIRKSPQTIIQSIQVIMLSPDYILLIQITLKFETPCKHFSKCQTDVWFKHCGSKTQNSLKREDLEVFWLPSQCCIWIPIASKYKLLLPWKPTTFPSVVVEVKNFPTSSPYGPYWPRLVWNVSDFMTVCFSSFVIDP